jgi:hypothetical protein
VAVGEADGKLNKAAAHGDPANADEEYYMKLLNFQLVDPPMPAREIKNITGVNHVFRGTMFGLDADVGKALRKAMFDHGRIH